ncbi:MAG: ABC transporter permease [Acidimicrobiales bacterium]
MEISQVPKSELKWRDALRDSAFGVIRRPTRTLLTALGIALGVASIVGTIGMSQSARGAVSSVFNAQLATQVSFVDAGATSTTQLLSQKSERNLERLDGVIHAGFMAQIDDGQPVSISRSPGVVPGSAGSFDFPFTIATPGALATMQASVSIGRLYDNGFEARHEMVALIGSNVADELGITQVNEGPAIFVNSVPLTIIGIVNRVSQQNQVLDDVIVPPDEGLIVGSNVGSPTIIVQTKLGAAQVVGTEGPYALAPDDPGAIVAQVPPDPSTLRLKIESSLTGLLLMLALVSLAIGMVAIANTTLLSVVQRTAEIGLRRSLGATPKHIALLIVIEGAMVGAVGGVLGASLGVLVTAITALAKGWTAELSWQTALLAPVLGAVVGMIAGLYPALRASKVSPVSALQNGL